MPVVEVAVCHRNGVLHDPKGQLVSGSNSQFDGDTHQQVGHHVREAVPLEPTAVEPGGQEGMARCQGAALNIQGRPTVLLYSRQGYSRKELKKS